MLDKFGIQAQSLTPKMAGELKLSRGVKGLLVTKTIRGSAAWRAKFKRGDIIISLGRYQVTDMNEAGELLDSVQTDQTVTFGVRTEHITRASKAGVADGFAELSATIDLIQPTGSRTYATFELGGVAVMAELRAHDVNQPGERIDLQVDMNRAIVIDPATDLVI